MFLSVLPRKTHALCPLREIKKPPGFSATFPLGSLVAMALIATFLTSGPVLAQTPENDEMAAAISITLNSTVSGDNTGATMGGSEINPGNRSGASVWYSFTSNSTQWVSVDTFAPEGLAQMDTVIAVFDSTGVMLGYNDVANGVDLDPSRLVFQAAENTDYYIAVYGYLGMESPFELHLNVDIPQALITHAAISPGTVDVTAGAQNITFSFSVDTDPLTYPSGLDAAEISLRPESENLVTGILPTNKLPGAVNSEVFEKQFSVPRYFSQGICPFEIRIVTASATDIWTPQGADASEDHFLIPAGAAGFQVNNSLTQRETWRTRWFQSIDNAGNAADDADPDKDGIKNFLEYAMDQNPLKPNAVPTSVNKQGSELQFTYPRSVGAVNEGVAFTVEWNDTLTGAWTAAVGNSTVTSSTWTSDQVLKTFPAGTGNKRFVRLRISK